MKCTKCNGLVVREVCNDGWEWFESMRCIMCSKRTYPPAITTQERIQRGVFPLFQVGGHA